MSRAVHAALTLLIGIGMLAGPQAHARGIWTPAQAQVWNDRQPWLIGVDYIPAYAVNELEMWQTATFDPAAIDKELGWAEGLGMNTMRVFLHDLLWQQDPQGFKKRIETVLALGAKHHIRFLFVLFDSCWEAEPKLGAQNPPIPGVHNSRWAQSPGLSALQDRAQEARLQSYVKGVVSAFASDDRVLGWDIWNEPGAQKPEDAARIAELLPQVYTWARSANPTQPLTSAVFESSPGDESHWYAGKPTDIEKIQLSESDILSFHNYRWPEEFYQQAKLLLAQGRPVWCTEYLARGAGSTYETILPIGKKLNVAMFNWGFVDGKTQTRLPWDSWDVPYVNGREPAVWHHDVLHSDGTPYRQAEADLIRAFARAPKGQIPDEIDLLH
jgi:hypothetical protein